jgi:hypothetical protein
MELACPACGAWDRPGVQAIERSQSGAMALCVVCSYSGPVAQFELKNNYNPQEHRP